MRSVLKYWNRLFFVAADFCKLYASAINFLPPFQLQTISGFAFRRIRIVSLVKVRSGKSAQATNPSDSSSHAVACFQILLLLYSSFLSVSATIVSFVRELPENLRKLYVNAMRSWFFLFKREENDADFVWKTNWDWSLSLTCSSRCFCRLMMVLVFLICRG